MATPALPVDVPSTSAEAHRAAAQADAPAWFKAQSDARDNPAPAPAEGPSAEAPAPAQVPPPDAPAPATAPTPAELDRWVARYGGDAAAAGKAAFEADSRAAAAVRELKDLRERLAGQPPPPTADAPPPPVPGPPEPVAPPVDVVAESRRLATEDGQCASWVESFKANQSAITTAQAAVSDLSRQIEQKQLFLNSEMVDELHKPALQEELHRLAFDRLQRAEEMRAKGLENEQLDRKWQARFGQIRDYVSQKEQARANQIAQASRYQADAATTASMMVALIPQIFTEHGILPDVQAEFRTALLLDVQGNMSSIPPGDAALAAFIRERAGWHAGYLKKAHGAQMGDYARQKRADATFNAPPGAAGVAPRPPEQRMTSKEADRLAAQGAREFFRR